MKKLLMLFSFMVLCIGTIAAQKTVSGTITDDSGVPLIGANVIIKGTTNGTITDVDGKYSLMVNEGDVLEISYTGFTGVEVPITGDSVFNTSLSTGQLLNEIVVSGQGAGVSRRRLSTTVDVLDADKIDQLPGNSIDQLLQSNAPGAQIRLSSGQAGTSAIIRSRGPISASSSSTPVVIVDGIRVDNLNSNPDLGITTGGANTSGFGDIPAESIEKIEYLKGGAATTIYGADAANGVIQIITKKGKNGKVTPFVEFRAGSITAEDKWLRYQRTGEAIFDPGSLTELKAGLSGGSEKFSFNFIGSLYQDDSYNDLNEQLKRSFNFGFQSKLSDNFTYQGSFSYTGFNFNLDYNANTSFSRFSAAEGGAYGNLDELSDEDWAERREFMQTQGALTNITNRVNRLIGSNILTYKFLNDFETSLTFGVENRSSRQQDLTSNAFLIHVGSIAEGTTDQASIDRSLRNVFTTTVNWNINHSKDLGDLSFLTNAGFRLFRTNDYQELVQGTQGVDGTISVNNFAVKTAEDFALENANYGFYLAENIGWKDMFFLDLGGTLDRNTNAGDNVGFQFLPKVGVAFNLGDFPAYKGSAISNTLTGIRVRANYGEATNFARPFREDRTFALESFLGAPAFRFANPGNPDLRSERVKTFEAGIDFGLFDYRVNLGATYYNGTTVDALFTPDNIPSSGQLAQVINIGEITNTGFEFDLRANVFSSGDHSFNINAAYNINDNKVSDSGGAPPFNVGGFLVIGTWIAEGESLGFLRGTSAELQEDGSYEFVPNTVLGSSFAPRFGSLGFDYTWDKLSIFGSSDFQFGGKSVDLSLLLRYLRGVEVDAVPEELQSQSFFNVVNFFTDDSDFWKVRNLGAAYNFGGLGNGAISNIKLGLNFTNPFNWTKANFDPEVTGSGIGAQNGFSSGGFAYGTESAPRQIIGTIKLSF